MQGSTISVSPIPQSTTTEKIRDIFHAFTVNNVHIDGKTAYVQFADEGDYDNLEIQFDNYEVAELNNAKIDKLQHFDWSSTKKEDTSPNKQSSSSSSRHEDLMAADIENLIIIQNCDEDILRNLTVENIRDFFKSFPSVHRIVKRKNDVVVEFTNIAEMQRLDTEFKDYHVPQLGKNASIEKADRFKVDPGDFVSDWQKFHAKQSLVTQPTTNLGYKDDKPSSGELEQGERFPTGSKEEKSSQQFLHHDIIPPFDKKTSMQVNFLNEQSKLGYKQEMKHEPIHEASTHQELDYTSEIKIESEDRFGYDAAEKQQEEQRKREQQQRRKEQQQRRKEQQQRKQQQQEQRRRQEEIRRKEQQERKRKQEEQRVRKQQKQRKIKEQQQLKRKKQEQARLKKQKEEEEAKRREEQEARKRAQQERMDRELRQKLIAQRAKFMKQIQMKKSQQEKQEEKHQVPTESQNAATEGQFVKKAEQTIEQQLGYAVNKAKEESANLLNAGLELLKGKTQEAKEKLGYDEQKLKEQGQKIVNSGKETIKEIGQKINQLGYREQPKPLQEGKNLLDTGLSFLKSSFQKIQEQLSNKAATGINSGDKKGPSELGYEKWSVKPDVVVEKPVSQPQNRTLVTLITITLFIWVIFLLMQDTSTVIQEIKEIQIQVPPPTEQSV